MLNEQTIKRLKRLAEREVWGDWEDLNPCESSGGNYDDAFYGGEETGETFLARDILDALDIKYTKPC